MHDYGRGGAVSHDVDIILRGGLLDDDAWFQGGEGGQKPGKKVTCNNK